ncbi:hypothetical protein VNO78_12707 [Psophocarpus tetragonolobus]|uniref:Bowman-Birk serine protease inhibitors family domain-containing protein n=1 Tax=Psophocarpus tetragonolobus TaxID=3891 RepID=A0AAN9XPR0_PSOTE
MELKALLKVGLVVLLMGFAATEVDARFDPGSLITQVLPEGGGYYYLKSKATACCDNCICTKSNPPQCQCVDWNPREKGCHSCCKTCICNMKYPSSCICTDRTSFCYDKCNPNEAKAH